MDKSERAMSVEHVHDKIFLESLQKFFTSSRRKKKCRCQFSDFSRHLRAFSIYL
jgi:redox-regulated HSP33 family molecular chaperone